MVSFVQGTDSHNKSNVYTGSATIQATIYDNFNNATVIEKDIVVVGKQKPYVSLLSMPSITTPNTTRTFTVLHCDQTPDDEILWIVSTPTGRKYYTGHNVDFTFGQSGTYTFKIINMDGCDPNDNTFEFSMAVMEPAIIKYANPVDETLNITIEDESRQVDDEYTVELWSDQMGKLKSVTTESTQLTINTAQFTTGYYTLRLNKNGKFVQTSTVLIK